MTPPPINHTLLLAILEVVKKGDSFGYHTVRIDIQRMPIFALVADEHFRQHWDILIENRCLIPIGYKKEVAVNEPKDCIGTYRGMVLAIEAETNDKSELNRLTLENLQYQQTVRDLQIRLNEALLQDIPVNAMDRKTISVWTVVLGVIAAIEFLLLIFGVRL